MESSRVLTDGHGDTARGPSTRKEPEVWQLIPPFLIRSPKLPGLVLNAQPPSSGEPASQRPFAQPWWQRESSDDSALWLKDHCCCGLLNWYCHGAHTCECPEVLKTVKQLGDGLARVRVQHNSAQYLGKQKIMPASVREALGRHSPDVKHCCELECCCNGLQHCTKWYCDCGWMRWHCDIHRFAGPGNISGGGLQNCGSDSLTSQMNLLSIQSASTSGIGSTGIPWTFPVPLHQQLWPSPYHESQGRSKMAPFFRSGSPNYFITLPPSSSSSPFSTSSTLSNDASSCSSPPAPNSGESPCNKEEVNRHQAPGCKYCKHSFCQPMLSHTCGLSKPFCQDGNQPCNATCQYAGRFGGQASTEERRRAEPSRATQTDL